MTSLQPGICPHFGPCGGCQLQNLTHSAQLAQKAAHLRTLLAAAPPMNCHPERAERVEGPAVVLPELQVHPSPPFAYRNRIRLTLAESGGQLRAGYLTSAPEPSSLGFLPITQCPIAAPILWRTAEAFLELINETASPWLGDARITPDQLELFTNAEESKLQLTLYLRTAAKTAPAKLDSTFTKLCESLLARIPQLTGAGIALLPAHSTQRSRRSEQPRPGPSWGSPGLNYSVAPLEPRTSNLEPATYWVPRGAFFQANRFLLPELLSLVAVNRAGDLAWDLYSGVGLFSRALARSFANVSAVEIAEPAFTALSQTKLPNLRAVKATTLDFLRAAAVQRDRPALIVLDPPRTGAGREVCELLARIAAPTLIFVSCSPETLPADLATLIASGYTLAELHLFDLFPQTTHIETVATLTRDRQHIPSPTPA